MNQALLENQENQKKEIAINHISREIIEVSELFQNMSILVHDQGNNIDNIEINILNGNQNIEQANTQLIKANKYQIKKRKCKCYMYICLCLCLCITIIIIVEWVKK